MFTYSSSKIIDQSQKVIVFQPKISKAFGRCPAVVLQQINYWLAQENSGQVYCGKRWIYNTYKDLAQQLGFSEITIKRAVKKLRDLGVILVKKLHKFKGNRTNFYTIDFEKLFVHLEQESSCLQECPKKLFDSIEMIQSSYKNDTIITNIPSKINSSPLSLEISKQKINRKKLSNEIFQTVSKKSQNRNQEENKEEFEKTPQQLLKIWNEEVEEGIRIITLTPRRAKFLMTAFRTVFNKNLDKWKRFCHLITKSDYLMGRLKNGFRASIDWFLKFETIHRIMEGDFGLTDFIKTLSEQKRTPETLREAILASSERQEIKQTQLKVLNLVGVNSYMSWFRDMIWEISSCGVSLLTNSLFKHDYIRDHFRDILQALTIRVCLKKD